MEEKKKGNFDDSLKLLAKTSIIVFIGVFISKLLAYLYRIIIARYYGPEVYGLFSLVTMILGMVLAFSSLGLLDGLARFVPQYRGTNEKDKIRYLFSFTNKVFLVTSFLSAILLFFLSDFIAINIFHNSELISYIKILSFFIPIAIFSNPFLAILRAYEKINIYSFIYNILQNVVRVLSILLLIFLGFNSSSTIVSYCFGFLIILVTAYLFSRYNLPEVFIRSSLSKKDKSVIRREFFSYSLPLLFFGIVSMLFYWVDSFFLGYFKGGEAVGFYNVAVPIALLLAVMPELFMQLFFPMINRHYSNNNFELIKQLSKQLGKWVLIVNLPIFILIFVFPGAAINILFGNQYLVVETSLRILIFGSFIASIGVISNNLLSMAGKSKLGLIDIIFVSVLNIILNILLIPMKNIFGIDNSLGINGAALATAFSIIFLNCLFFFQTKKYLGIIPIRAKMLNVLLIGFVSAFALIYLRSIFVSSNIILVGVLALGFLIFYLSLLLISKSFDKNDWNIIKLIWKRLLKW